MNFKPIRKPSVFIWVKPIRKPSVFIWVKPIRKPSVIYWLNPCAKSGLTIKQNKTKQEGVGLVLKTKPNPLTCLPVNLTSKVISLASSLCERSRNARIGDFEPLFSTGFPQSFPHCAFGGD